MCFLIDHGVLMDKVLSPEMMTQVVSIHSTNQINYVAGLQGLIRLMSPSHMHHVYPTSTLVGTYLSFFWIWKLLVPMMVWLYFLKWLWEKLPCKSLLDYCGGC